VAYEDLEQPLKPKVYFVHTGIYTDQNRFAFRRGRVNMARLTNWLAENEQRNKLIAKYLNHAAKKGREVLVLGERLTQLHDLHGMVKTRDKALHVGAMDDDEREEALTKQVVLATQHLAKEGLDKPSLDTLFILIPFGGAGRLQQSKGRIEREYEGKQAPIVYIFVDSIKIMQSIAAKMERYLLADGCEVRHIRTEEGR
jgi:superfamily II DNA or RNA helicase